MHKYVHTVQVEVCDGVREYFNAMLGAQLLHKFETPPVCRCEPAHSTQHEMHISDNLTVMEEDSLTLLLCDMHDFLKYCHEEIMVYSWL